MHNQKLYKAKNAVQMHKNPITSTSLVNMTTSGRRAYENSCALNLNNSIKLFDHILDKGDFNFCYTQSK